MSVRALPIQFDLKSSKYSNKQRITKQKAYSVLVEFCQKKLGPGLHSKPIRVPIFTRTPNIFAFKIFLPDGADCPSIVGTGYGLTNQMAEEAAAFDLLRRIIIPVCLELDKYFGIEKPTITLFSGDDTLSHIDSNEMDFALEKALDAQEQRDQVFSGGSFSPIERQRYELNEYLVDNNQQHYKIAQYKKLPKLSNEKPKLEIPLCHTTIKCTDPFHVIARTESLDPSKIFRVQNDAVEISDIMPVVRSNPKKRPFVYEHDVAVIQPKDVYCFVDPDEPFSSDRIWPGFEQFEYKAAYCAKCRVTQVGWYFSPKLHSNDSNSMEQTQGQQPFFVLAFPDTGARAELHKLKLVPGSMLVYIDNENPIRTTSSSIVFKGEYRDPSIPRSAVAVKKTSMPIQQNGFLAELKAISSIQHPNLVSYKSHHIHEGFIYIVMELAFCDLHDLILKHKPNNSAQDLLDFTRQLLEGIEYLHSKGFSHRDIKPENILVFKEKSSFKLKLCDFGFAKNEIDESQSPLVGTLRYMAPELTSNLKSEKKNYRNSDIWSLGATLGFIFHDGHHPQDLDVENEDWQENKKNNKQRPWHVSRSSLAKHLIHSMMSPDPSLRPSASGCLQFAYFWSEAQVKATILDDILQSKRFRPLLNQKPFPFWNDSQSWDQKIEPKLMEWLNRSSYEKRTNKYNYGKLFEFAQFVGNFLKHFQNQEYVHLLKEVLKGKSACRYVIDEWPELLNFISDQLLKENQTGVKFPEPREKSNEKKHVVVKEEKQAVPQTTTPNQDISQSNQAKTIPNSQKSEQNQQSPTQMQTKKHKASRKNKILNHRKNKNKN